VKRELDLIHWRSPSGKTLTWKFLAWKEPGHKAQAWLHATGVPKHACYVRETPKTEVGVWTVPGKPIFLPQGNFRPAVTSGRTITLSISHSYANSRSTETATLNAQTKQFKTDKVQYQRLNGQPFGADTRHFTYPKALPKATLFFMFNPVPPIPRNQICPGTAIP
jgi:hypothetical protein